jgi:hypothetical protein
MPMRWRRVGLVLLYLAAVPAGLASAWWTLKRVDAFGSAAGAWRVSLLAGSAEADLYTRARVALGGLLALNRSETMYYIAGTDSSGAPLRSRCSYRIEGRPPPARWWSVTAYAEDMFLFPNAERRYSVHGGNVGLDARGRFAFITGPLAPAAVAGLPWVPTPGDRGLVLTLRLYQPAPALQSAPQTLEPPRIEPLGDCR